jgi:lipoprotein-anchoring transpeptidase ErfK/SrfK
MRISLRRNAFAAAAAVLLAAPLGAGLDAQSRRPPESRAGQAAANPLAGVRSESLARGGYAVVIDLDDNRLYFAKGRQVLWSAPVGTGTGMRLRNGRGEWNFATPTGTYHAVYKQIEPDWIAPDWYFVENGLRGPARDSDARRFPRGLGSAAVFIGQGLAIHGTDRPELLGQRVSHGCIRLSNADALRLYHNVQVGTEIVIVGGRNARPAAPPPPRTTSRPRGPDGRPAPPPRDPAVVALERLGTARLLDRMDDELVAAAAVPSAESRWPLVASVLVLRGTTGDDDDALEGLLARITRFGSGTLRDEYATFLADAFNQRPLRVVDALARMERAPREAAARAIVESKLGLYPGDLAAVSAPWPTGRVPDTAVGRSGRRGWEALAAAEARLRRRVAARE